MPDQEPAPRPAEPDAPAPAQGPATPPEAERVLVEADALLQGGGGGIPRVNKQLLYLGVFGALALFFGLIIAYGSVKPIRYPPTAHRSAVDRFPLRGTGWALLVPDGYQPAGTAAETRLSTSGDVTQRWLGPGEVQLILQRRPLTAYPRPSGGANVLRSVFFGESLQKRFGGEVVQTHPVRAAGHRGAQARLHLPSGQTLFAVGLQRGSTVLEVRFRFPDRLQRQLVRSVVGSLQYGPTSAAHEETTDRQQAAEE